MTRAAPDNRHQILALTGGGFRGVFSATLLAHCEAEWGAHCADRFQLFAGTSVGALLAAGFAAGRTAKQLQTAMGTHGPNIFAPRILDGPRRLFGTASYRTEPLRKAAEAVLGMQKDVLLSDFQPNLVVTAVNYSKGTTEIFTSKGVSGAAASKVKLVDAILASAAAPTFFPMLKIRQYDYADGGLVANAPDMVALIEAMSQQYADIERTYMLSVGTANFSEGTTLRDTADKPGTITALWKRRLVQTTMAAQEDLALQQIRVIMRNRHLRIDRAPDRLRATEIRSLDNATPASFAALVQVADEAWSEVLDRQRQGDYQLRDFFAR
jgi:patatin-like phospholipase/acyl hydrolase